MDMAESSNTDNGRATSGNDYRKILRNMSAFGGVQILCILINIVKGKFIAMFLGPSGIGVSQLLTSSINTVQQLASLGTDKASVREIAETRGESGDAAALPAIIATVRHLITITAVAGALICCAGSPWLSLLAFGDYSHTLSFVTLSVAVALSIAGAGYLAILQGMGMVRRISKASLTGAATGLLICVPLFYLFGTRAIVPSILVMAASVYIFYYISFRQCVRLNNAGPDVSFQRNLTRRIFTLGIILMAGSLSAALTQYLINLIVRGFGSVADVGLFQAAYAITLQYSGIIFSTLAMDYYPRLASLGHDNRAMRISVCRQSEIVLLVVTPLVCTLIATAPWVIRILLTDEFLPVTTLMRWMGVGVFLQAILFPVDYMFLARGNRKIYFWTEVVISNTIWLACSFTFYFIYGLDGLGISFMVRNIIYIIISLSLTHRCYAFGYFRRTLTCLAFSTAFVAGAFASTWLEGFTSLTVLTAIILSSGIYSFLTLRRRLHTNSPSYTIQNKTLSKRLLKAILASSQDSVKPLLSRLLYSRRIRGT